MLEKLVLNSAHAVRARRLFALVSALFVISCSQIPGDENLDDHPTEIDDDAFLGQLSLFEYCWAPGAISDYDRIDATQYTIDPRAVPGFYIVAGEFDDIATDDRILVVMSDMPSAPPCDRYRGFFARSDRDIAPVANWEAVAGEDAINAVGHLERECIESSAEQAFDRFGISGPREPGAAGASESDSFAGCKAAIRSLVYAVHVSIPIGGFVVTNVFGDLYVEELD